MTTTSDKENTLMAYTEMYLVIDGAQADEMTFTDEDAIEAWIASLHAELSADGIVGELFRIDHGHAEDGDGCECVQYLTDHHAYRTVGIPKREGFVVNHNGDEDWRDTDGSDAGDRREWIPRRRDHSQVWDTLDGAVDFAVRIMRDWARVVDADPNGMTRRDFDPRVEGSVAVEVFTTDGEYLGFIDPYTLDYVGAHAPIAS